MKKTIYIVLSVLTTILLGGTLYYTYTHQTIPTAPVAPPVATTTEEVSIPAVPTTVLMTQTNKKITISDTHPDGESLSTVNITTEGFATNSPVVINDNRLTDFFILDLNKDHYDELVIITQAQGSGSEGGAVIFTTASDTGLIPVTIPKIQDTDIKKGGLFEGYMGHDSFSTSTDGLLIRSFPTYLAKDSNDNPTGPTRSIVYNLIKKGNDYSMLFIKGTTTPYKAVATTTSITAPVQAVEASTVAPSSSPSSLVPNSWIWISGSSNGLAPAGEKFILSFDDATHMHSSTDCNALSGEYAADKNMIEFSSFSATKKACEGSQESKYSSMLAQTVSYVIENDRLVLTLSDKAIMSFKRK